MTGRVYAASEQGEGALAELLKKAGAKFAGVSGPQIAAALSDLIIEVDRRAQRRYGDVLEGLLAGAG